VKWEGEGGGGKRWGGKLKENGRGIKGGNGGGDVLSHPFGGRIQGKGSKEREKHSYRTKKSILKKTDINCVVPERKERELSPKLSEKKKLCNCAWWGG